MRNACKTTDRHWNQRAFEKPTTFGTAGCRKVHDHRDENVLGRESILGTGGCCKAYANEHARVFPEHLGYALTNGYSRPGHDRQSEVEKCCSDSLLHIATETVNQWNISQTVMIWEYHRNVHDTDTRHTDAQFRHMHTSKMHSTDTCIPLT